MMDRYQKQMLLKELGASGQQKLLEAKILVVGAGGLGCPALQYLTAAGIGRIGIVDFDVVERSNLHRQLLYGDGDIGRAKAEVAAERLKALHPEVMLDVYVEKMDSKNALKLLAGYDLVVEGTDNFPSRYLLNDACVLLGKPLVHGSVFRFEGQLSVFNWLHQGVKTNYRDLFPIPPKPGEVANCEEAGVIGTLPGIIGTMQANEAIKMVTGIGVPLANRLWTYNGLNHTVYELQIEPGQRQGPQTTAEFENMNYTWFCDHTEAQYAELTGEDFGRMLLEKTPLVVDVRNRWEQPQPADFEYLQIPLSELESNLHQLTTERPIVVFCQTGIRSITAARMIAHRLGHPYVYNLKGGIVQWKRKQ